MFSWGAFVVTLSLVRVLASCSVLLCYCCVVVSVECLVRPFAVIMHALRALLLGTLNYHYYYYHTDRWHNTVPVHAKRKEEGNQMSLVWQGLNLQSASQALKHDPAASVKLSWSKPKHDLASYIQNTVSKPSN